METNDIDLGAAQNVPCPYCGSTAGQALHDGQVRCSECGNSFTPTGEIVHASMPARTERAPAPARSPAAATGLHCPRCFAPGGQPHSAGCNEAGLASAVRKAIDMLAGVVAAAPNGPLALPAVLGVLRSGLEADSSAPRDAMLPLNAQTRFVLGRPNFACIGMSARLRQLGHKIDNKAEAEQAACIHLMLTMYQKHGEDWRARCEAYLKGSPTPPTARAAS